MLKSFMVLISFFSMISFSAMAKVVVGKVNIQKILLTVKEGKAVRDRLKKEFDKKQATLKKEEEKIRKMQSNLKKGEALFTKKKKEDMEKKIKEKILEIQETSVKYQKEIQGTEQKLKGPILKKLKGVIDAVSKAENVDMTFEVSTAPVVYTRNSKDLTEKVIKAYDKKYK